MFSLIYRIEVEAQQWPWAAPRSLHFPPAPHSLQADPQHSTDHRTRGEGKKTFFFLCSPPFQAAEVVWGSYTAIGVQGKVGVMISSCPQGKAAAPSLRAQPRATFLPSSSSSTALDCSLPQCHPHSLWDSAIFPSLARAQTGEDPSHHHLPRGRPQEHWDRRHWGPSAQELAPHSAQRPAGWAVRAFGDSSRAWCHPGPIARSWGSVPPQEGAVGGFSVETATVGRTGEAVGKISHG